MLGDGAIPGDEPLISALSLARVLKGLVSTFLPPIVNVAVL
jgi:hypothetical protein